MNKGLLKVCFASDMKAKGARFATLFKSPVAQSFCNAANVSVTRLTLDSEADCVCTVKNDKSVVSRKGLLTDWNR